MYACRVGVRRVVRLGNAKGDPRVAGLHVAGYYVGYWIASQNFKDSTDGQDVRTVDTRTRHVRTRGTCGSTFDYKCGDLVLTAGGAVAWTNLDRRAGSGAVWKSDATGESQELDEDPLGPISGLALSGSTLYWTKRGVASSATLK